MITGEGGCGHVACREKPPWGPPCLRREATADPPTGQSSEGGILPHRAPAVWPGAVRCRLEAQSVCHLVLSTWASWACKGGPDLPSSYLGALSHLHPMTETLLLPHGDTRDPGPVAAAQPPALPLSRITPEVKSWRVPHLPVAMAALLPHRLPSCTVLGVSTSNPRLWALLHAGRCRARRTENDHGEK